VDSESPQFMNISQPFAVEQDNKSLFNPKKERLEKTEGQMSNIFPQSFVDSAATSPSQFTGPGLPNSTFPFVGIPRQPPPTFGFSYDMSTMAQMMFSMMQAFISQNSQISTATQSTIQPIKSTVLPQWDSNCHKNFTHLWVLPQTLNPKKYEKEIIEELQKRYSLPAQTTWKTIFSTIIGVIKNCRSLMYRTLNSIAIKMLGDLDTFVNNGTVSLEECTNILSRIQQNQLPINCFEVNQISQMDHESIWSETKGASAIIANSEKHKLLFEKFLSLILEFQHLKNSYPSSPWTKLKEYYYSAILQYDGNTWGCLDN